MCEIILLINVLEIETRYLWFYIVANCTEHVFQTQVGWFSINLCWQMCWKLKIKNLKLSTTFVLINVLQITCPFRSLKSWYLCCFPVYHRVPTPQAAMTPFKNGDTVRLTGLSRADLRVDVQHSFCNVCSSVLFWGNSFRKMVNIRSHFWRPCFWEMFVTSENIERSYVGGMFQP